MLRPRQTGGQKESIVFKLKLRETGMYAAIASVALASGCMCVSVPDEKVEQIKILRRQGITWRTEAEAGRFTPPINQRAALGWSFIPGAGQHFIAHKMGDAGIEDTFSTMRLRLEGTLMLMVSWIPFVYPVTLIGGMFTGTAVDVNRINYLTYLRQCEEQGIVIEAPQLPGKEAEGSESIAFDMNIQTKPSSKPIRDDTEQLRKLADLQNRYDQGLCTEEEFARERDKIMNEQ